MVVPFGRSLMGVGLWDDPLVFLLVGFWLLGLEFLESTEAGRHHAALSPPDGFPTGDLLLGVGLKGLRLGFEGLRLHRGCLAGMTFDPSLQPDPNPNV